MDASPLLERARAVRAAAREHRLPTHAAAIAFRVLVALVPLTLLGAALLGTLGLESVWRDTIAPPLRDRLQDPTFVALDFAVTEIWAGPSGLLLALASGLLLWELTRGVRAVSVALNEIHGIEEGRPWPKLAGVTVGLALAVGLCLIGAALAMIVGGRAGLLLAVLRFPVAILLLGLAVGLLLRYAPAEHPEPRWASAGSAAIVVGWLLLSLGFGVWVGRIASYQSAVGNLTAFLVLTSYVLALSAVFLAGVEIDEAARTTGGRSGRKRASSGR